MKDDNAALRERDALESRRKKLETAMAESRGALNVAKAKLAEMGLKSKADAEAERGRLRLELESLRQERDTLLEQVDVLLKGMGG